MTIFVDQKRRRLHFVSGRGLPTGGIVESLKISSSTHSPL